MPATTTATADELGAFQVLFQEHCVMCEKVLILDIAEKWNYAHLPSKSQQPIKKAGPWVGRLLLCLHFSLAGCELRGHC
jgi:hypothetical protein